MSSPLLKIEGLSYKVYSHKTPYNILSNISLDLYPGETLGLVGESGSGKTTLGKLLLRILTPSSGHLFYEGKEYADFTKDDLKSFRREVQMVFQDPYSSLNPRMTVEEIIKEPLVVVKERQNLEAKVYEMLDLVGLDAYFAEKYPHELSGGQRQRVAIARALILRPKCVILDEPIAALDVSIQAQIINLLKDLQRELGLTYLFISHDLSIVKYLSDRVAVMYLGEIIERASSEELYQNPLHPYTQMLFSAVPKISFGPQKSLPIWGEVPPLVQNFKGCPFMNRCPMAVSTCETYPPKETDISGSHFVSCHLYETVKS